MIATMVVLLAAAVFLAPLASRLGLGAIVGYLAAGILIGPWGLAAVTDVDELSHVSELGVVLMLFVIGLELEPRRLWSMRRDVFGSGATQILACGAALGALAGAVGLGLRPALLVGLTLALSSTAVAVQMLVERNLMATPSGRVGFAILLAQDLAAIPLITLAALLAAWGHASAAVPGTVRPLWLSLGVLAAVVVTGRFLLRGMFRMIAASGMREVFTAAALLVVLAMALAMQWAGLSMGLGAFVAGVLLADSEYRTALETDIEPFKGLLLGLFFVSVGMSLGLPTILARWPAVLATAIALFAVKALVIAALAPFLGIGRGMRTRFALLLAQGSEFAFVVFAAARTSGLLDDDLTSVLVSAVALSMAFTPVAVSLAERWQARRQTAARPDDVIVHAHAPVIIAGFGRVGQIVGRLLFANGIRATVLDHDPDQIEFLRGYGYKVFYGDATRLDLLRAAGAAEAKLLVVAIDDIDDNLRLVDIAGQHFPNLRILARARNVRHVFELQRRGVDLIERETFESSLRLGRSALEALGLSAHESKRVADRFRHHNRRTLAEMRAHYGDDARMQSAAREARQELEESMRRERELATGSGEREWR